MGRRKAQDDPYKAVESIKSLAPWPKEINSSNSGEMEYLSLQQLALKAMNRRVPQLL